MKSSTIWESASRPLFVRTVWLESSELRRGLQRQFLLDYNTKRPLERLNTAVNPLERRSKEPLKRSISLELNNSTDFDEFNKDKEEEVFLIGSAKVKLHEPCKLVSGKKSKRRRRSSILNRKYSSYESYPFSPNKDFSRRPSESSELYSKNNTLTSQQTSETADELLAERVLHWLDLAGKEAFLKNLHSLEEMEVKLSKTSKLRQDAIKSYNTKAQSSQKPKQQKSKSNPRASIDTAAQLTRQRNLKSSEAVKHITIIFNKEGQPIRLNRPVKNIDLCALSSSPSTTRRLAGTLASARLYKSAENSRGLNIPKTSFGKSKTGNSGNKSLSARRRLDTVADLTNSTLQKRLHENPMQESYNNLLDSKKQLHIFMPTLLKKSLGKSIYGTDDGISELSQNFSELCRI